jgi:ribosomal protein S27AE
MKESNMPRKKSRTQRKAEFLHAAEAMYERMEDWYDAHPDASFAEIEAELRRQRRGLMGGTLETLIVGRDTGFDVEPPKCPTCGQPMAFQDYRPWTVKGLEGDSKLERAYYTCPACGAQGFSPSGPEAAATE